MVLGYAKAGGKGAEALPCLELVPYPDLNPSAVLISQATECAQERHKNVDFIKERGDKRELAQNQRLNKWEQAVYFILENSLWLLLQLREGAECLKTEESSLQNVQKKRANGIGLLLWRVPNIYIVTAVGRPGSRHIALPCCCFCFTSFSKEGLLLGAVSVAAVGHT